ncbi:MAG: GNAT family N-acetyltransferase [Anaerolineae bacterium]|uniref:GNAT family N-acetyltransferase n=1 Tax=Thermoflexus sp. TaxID=1969742 RepID=UPI00260129AE|nr:GNAT family N-acetyltransferase [Thermoflexus sp.]MCS7352340.1 GNAT family N-acetyltransferase [Thermoflexus sp.]MDW8181803.1 GNAT family N-acetyltransferase [Anaerolineae bacterium]MDW8185557.1 GNAT family N-acetyltransferase [Anaerolineae bacterium]
MRLCSFQGPEVFEELTEAWIDLLRRSSVDSPFLRPGWLRTWWEHLGEGELHVLTFEEGGRLIGIAPLRRIARDGRRVLETFSEEVTDYLDLPVESGREEELAHALLAWLISPAAPEWDLLILWNIREDSPIYGAWSAVAPAYGLVARAERLTVCPVLSLPATWEAYLQMLDGKDRHELRRKMRRVEALESVRWYILREDGPDAEEAIEAFLDLMAVSSPEKADFLSEGVRAFLRQAIRQGLREGWARLSFMEIEGEKAATYLDFDYRDRIWLYNAGFNPRFAGLSPGIVLLAYLIRQAIEQGKPVFDFLRGDEPYKFRFGAREVPLYRILISRPE